LGLLVALSNVESIQPILISTGNSLAATGLPWRHLREHAAELGIEILKIGRKGAVRSADLLAALARLESNADGAGEPPIDSAEALRARLGLRRRL
jgi:hypothetical protein